LQGGVAGRAGRSAYTAAGVVVAAGQGGVGEGGSADLVRALAERSEGEKERVGERETQGQRRRLGENEPGATRVSSWALVGLRVREVFLFFVFFLFFYFRNAFLNSSKIHKNSPKLFINKIFIFRLITIILFNYYIYY
jgi:hypothetical protein